MNMAPTLVSEMVRGSLAPVRDALRQEKRPSTQDLLNAFSYLTNQMEQFRVWIDSILDDGIESRKLAFMVKEALDSLDETLRLLADARDNPPGNQPLPLADLEENTRRVERVRGDFLALLRWLEAPPPKVDLVALERGKTGKTEDLDSILARLHAGGDL